MQVTYGSYPHAVDEAGIEIKRSAKFNERGDRTGYKEVWTIHGFLQAASVGALTTALAALEAAYSVDFQDLHLLTDSGGATQHNLLSSACLGGTRVTQPPTYPEWQGAEYTTYRNYVITVEGDVSIATVQFDEWVETLTFKGTGGPRFILLPLANGLPQKQTVQQFTPRLATQTGHAVGRFAFPVPPAPLFPQDEHVDQRQITKSGPRKKGPNFTDYEINWSYVFETTRQIGGIPTVQKLP